MSGEHIGFVGVIVIVNNINNCHPVFDNIDPVQVPETTPVNTIIATVHASDADNNTPDALSHCVYRAATSVFNTAT